MAAKFCLVAVAETDRAEPVPLGLIRQTGRDRRYRFSQRREIGGGTGSFAALLSFLVGERVRTVRKTLGEFGCSRTQVLATIKTHLHHIFDKTGTHRQAELVRLLLAIKPG